MSILSNQDLNDIFNSNEFLLNYDDYIKKKECLNKLYKLL